MVTTCKRYGQFINPLEVDAVTYGERLNFTSNKVSSMNSLVYQNIVYLYAGSDGTIEQVVDYNVVLIIIIILQFYFATATNSLNFIRSIPVTINEPVNKITFSSDSEYLYALSSTNVSMFTCMFFRLFFILDSYSKS